ncbi:leucine-rich repeat, immunoglobulin-like domain and transmembrane domain-containing protein 2 [Rhinatrema bivittatum]|uniref:leucine-rich repeat, immunoglobulin-like domain and transmembrane domain-containing protein 2 n=1 Tax=Rhinatrema bivittatum TaxID=194408 RepID=UPI00112C30FE|nr:leucine-rich repeat, immunoglobulin-like domain and transmembrane domain-containing protein 2 [Rhinatrema bivittatum]
MDPLYYVFLMNLVLIKLNTISSFCIIGCSCSNNSSGRSLLCMASTMRKIPENIPPDIRKIRIENCHLTELPPGSFATVSALKYLWLNFNNITVMHLKSLEYLKDLTELRLQGNRLLTVPWTAFQDTPALKILDLKHNRLDVLPDHALRYLANLTYLDFSFNQLTVISKDVFSNWPLYQKTQLYESRAQTAPGSVLALHENPWICDCRLQGFVQFIKSVSPPIILMNPYLMCSSPHFWAGKFFHEIELSSCTKPITSALLSNLTVQVGWNVSLICLATASPFPEIFWTYTLAMLRAFTVSATHVDEDTAKSELVIPSAHVADEGMYTCTATNFLGNSSTVVSLKVTTPESSSPSSSFSYSLPPPTSEERAFIDLRISKQTVYGISLEWHAATGSPAVSWYTIYLGKYGDANKETISIGPGINRYTVNDLLPATKYEVCITLKKQLRQKGQCIVFITGRDISQLEQREKLIHIIVIVCIMVLAMPVGLYACITETRCNCMEKFSVLCHKKKNGKKTLKSNNEENTFDNLQASSDEGLCCHQEGNEHKRCSEDKLNEQKSNLRNNAELDQQTQVSPHNIS